MNAAGESDLINCCDKIAQLQESDLRPVLEKLLPIMCMSVFGRVPDDIDIEFNPVAETGEEERANLIQQSSGAILQVFQGGLISRKTALKELRQSGVAYNMWSNIADEDIENAKKRCDVMRAGRRYERYDGGCGQSTYRRRKRRKRDAESVWRASKGS